MTSSAFSDRPLKKVILFDVDGTLTPARQAVSRETIDVLRALRKKAVIGVVGGSNFVKISEQLSVHGFPVVEEFDYTFAENGLTAYKLGKPLPSQSFIQFLGEERYKRLVNFILHYIADLDIPIKRGTFVEFRNGMVNVSPMGRNATIEERNEYEIYDKQHGIRTAFVEALKEKFPDYGLTFSIGGQISFDVFPNGWDKTFCLQHVQDEGFEEIHFFGDKTYKGGNDYEIYSDPRTIGHSVTSPQDTVRILKELFPNVLVRHWLTLVIQPTLLPCEWGECKARLNSWKALQEHLRAHCYQGHLWESHDCKIQKCAGRKHGTLQDLQLHVDLSHLSRVHLPCPIQGCNQIFGRHFQVAPHFESNHAELLDTAVEISSSIFRPLRSPKRPTVHKPPEYPLDVTPSFWALEPDSITRTQRTYRAPTSSQSSRKWSRMDAQDTEDEHKEGDQPFEDLPVLDTIYLPEVNEFAVRRKPPETTDGQLSRPQPVIYPLIPEQVPPLSMGYVAFADRFEQLEVADLIDGSGVWPADREQSESPSDK
ncbi:Phosphomannomutase [Grifola frondosa]|uniref:Phosphomannomutase n=1 Tax=Grifola frondosa TaxID=5627 RepID=A0A1C7MET4_GRIFR|nr:Phosphomannomutase [Grifola frondosa]